MCLSICDRELKVSPQLQVMKPDPGNPVLPILPTELGGCELSLATLATGDSGPTPNLWNGLIMPPETGEVF